MVRWFIVDRARIYVLLIFLNEVLWTKLSLANIIGGLQYLPFTRLDLTFVVDKVRAYLCISRVFAIGGQLSKFHVILHFFISDGLYISKNAILSLHSFIDVDWGDHDDRESVSLL